MTVQEVFAERLLTLRESRGLTRQQLAEELGVTRASLEYYEKGKRKPDIEMLVKISKCFPVSTDYLLGLTQAVTADKDIQAVCEYTGLTSEAVEVICNELLGDSIREIINSFLRGFKGKDSFQRTESFRAFCDALITYRKALNISNDHFTDQLDHVNLFEMSATDRDKVFNEAQSSKDSVNAAEYQVIQRTVKLLRLYSDGLYDENKELQGRFEHEKLTYMLDTDRSDNDGSNQETQ